MDKSAAEKQSKFAVFQGKERWGAETWFDRWAMSWVYKA